MFESLKYLSKELGDARRFLLEDIILYSSLIIINLALDFLFNVLIATGLEPGPLHPYHFGAFQILGLLFCAFQLFRKLSEWRYWWKYWNIK
jgi:hypothetical protein